MKRITLSVVLACLLINPGSQSWAEPQPSIEVFFSPQGGCTEAVVKALDHATNTALVQAYSFTSAPIAKALVDAHKRGVKVQVILNKSQRAEQYSSADIVAHAGIPTIIDAKNAIPHNKIMLIDGYEILTGSFNFTKAEEEKFAGDLGHFPGGEIHGELAETLKALGGFCGAVIAPNSTDAHRPS